MKDKTYTITIHVKNKERTVRMEVPAEVMHDAHSRNKTILDMIESACNMFGIPDLGQVDPEAPADYETLKYQAGCSITCAFPSELHKIICNTKFTPHYRRMALVEWERRCSRG